MKFIWKLALPIAACVMLSACITTRSYVDPQYHVASYAQIQHPAGQVPVRVLARFERNGQAFPAVDAGLHDLVERTLRATGVFTAPAESTGGAVVEVVANNIADIKAARSRGFSAGLTFGASGANVPDLYDFTFIYRDAAGKQQRMSYHHAIYTSVGQASAPVSSTPTTAALAFGQVVEDVTLNFVKALQDQGAVARH